MAKIVSYNVNGIRAALSKGYLNWLTACDPDVICLQEVKANADQLDVSLFENLGYHLYWHAAQKKGYSGVALLSKQKPDHVEYGCSIDRYDCEGRVLRADFGKVSIMNVYMPSGSSGDERQAFKMRWLEDFYNYIALLKERIPALVISGD